MGLLPLLLAFQAAAAPAAQNTRALVPVACLAAPTIPALPPRASGWARLEAAAAVPRGVRADADAVGAVRTLASELVRAGFYDAGQASLSSDFFDGRAAGGRTYGSQTAAQPKVPAGVKSVSVDEVMTAADVDRLIPYGANSRELIIKLKRNVRRMAPYSVYTYHDVFGGTFTAIDLSRNPNLIDHFPEYESHEINLIKTIQILNTDLQLIVREDGMTPDIILGGTIIELKSWMTSGPEKTKISKLLEKANRQVYDHAQRHGLGRGAVAIDLVEFQQVPIAKIQVQLDGWSRGVPRIALEKVFVFAGLDMRVFVLGADGAFHAADFVVAHGGPRLP